MPLRFRHQIQALLLIHGPSAPSESRLTRTNAPPIFDNPDIAQNRDAKLALANK